MGATVLNDNSHSGSGESRSRASSAERATAAIRFRIAGAARFLSHAETFRVFQRACARAVLPVRYTEGFNPHPRLSLPLPRPVGVEADDELLVARLHNDWEAGPVGKGSPVQCTALGVPNQAQHEAAMKQALAEQLPEGIEVLAVELAPAGTSFHPRSARYILPVRTNDDAGVAERLRDAIARVMASDRCMVERASGEGKVTKSVDVRPFLCSIRVEGANLLVQHLTGEGGSIRVDEIMQLLDLQTQDLAGPVRRTGVTWETTKLKRTSHEPCMETRAEDIEDGT